MSEPIRVGDLVIVVKGFDCKCVVRGRALGRIFTVGEIRLANKGLTYCVHCGVERSESLVAIPTHQDRVLVYSLWRLRRIPPLTQLDEAERKEELPA